MATAKLQRLSAADFDRLADMTQLQAVARAMAREYFVNGCALTEVANKFDTSKQRVNLAVGSIRRVYKASGGVAVQQAWVRFEEEIPQGIHGALAAFVKELKRCPAENPTSKSAIDQVSRALERATWSMK